MYDAMVVLYASTHLLSEHQCQQQHWDTGLDWTKHKTMVTGVKPNTRQLWPQCTTIMLCIPFQESKRMATTRPVTTAHKTFEQVMQCTVHQPESWQLTHLEGWHDAKTEGVGDFTSVRDIVAQFQDFWASFFHCLWQILAECKHKCNEGNNQGPKRMTPAYRIGRQRQELAPPSHTTTHLNTHAPTPYLKSKFQPSVSLGN